MYEVFPQGVPKPPEVGILDFLIYLLKTDFLDSLKALISSYDPFIGHIGVAVFSQIAIPS